MHGSGVAVAWMILSTLLWLALIGAILWSAHRLSAGGAGQRRETPLEVLDRRFAAGEIDAATYDDTRSRLISRQPPAG